jgi:hypothetical protein
MTYARSRLWLGISAVGSLVVWAGVALWFEWPSILSPREAFAWRDLAQLMGVLALWVVWLLPFDFLGGYELPRRFKRSEQTFGDWFLSYLVGMTTQVLMYLLAAIAMLTAARAGGWLAGVAAAAAMVLFSNQIRTFLILRRRVRGSTPARLAEAVGLASEWLQTKGMAGHQSLTPDVVAVIDHRDAGFTGGTVYVGSQPRVLIPATWVNGLSAAQLACVLARRWEAVETGAFRRAVGLAYAWNLGGLAISATLPMANLSSVAGLVATLCYLTIWSFIGLLFLPSLSRQAAHALDARLLRRSIPADVLQATALVLDGWQDAEPQRAAWIERVFHPIPNAATRGSAGEDRPAWAWNAARVTIAGSWGCCGLLSRAVHCNLGRPELWELLPVD